MPRVEESYITASAYDLDLRPKSAHDPQLRTVPYIQTFADRLPFTAGLSFADLLFCEGPDATALLLNSLH